jgi:hypothetical protein
MKELSQQTGGVLLGYVSRELSGGSGFVGRELRKHPSLTRVLQKPVVQATLKSFEDTKKSRY